MQRDGRAWVGQEGTGGTRLVARRTAATHAAT